MPEVTEKESKCNVSVEAFDTGAQLAYDIRTLALSTALLCVYVLMCFGPSRLHEHYADGINPC